MLHIVLLFQGFTLDHDLDVFPVINKIDLPSADPDRVAAEIEDVIGLEAHDAPKISAKTGLNVEEVLEAIVHKIPAPKGDPKAPLQALIFDSVYDSYKGVIIFCRVMEGTVKKGTPIRMMATGAEEEVVEVGYFGAGQFIPCDELAAGMVGYITASIKNVRDTRVGDTVTDSSNPCAAPLPGYKKVTPMVYCGLYPADGAKYNDLRDALEKLQLNDASLFYEPETSVALGFGFRCGFLGLLHLEIIQERLEREYNLDLSNSCSVRCWIIISKYINSWKFSCCNLCNVRHKVVWNSVRIFADKSTLVCSNWVKVTKKNYIPFLVCKLNVCKNLFKH